VPQDDQSSIVSKTLRYIRHRYQKAETCRRTSGGTTVTLGPGVRVCSDVAEISRIAADRIVEVARQPGIPGRRASLVLPGGKTPRLLYRLLAGEYRERVSWSSVDVFWGDERCVPPDDPESNYGMAQALCLSRVPIPGDQVHRIRAEGDPVQAAALYATEITAFFALGPGEWPHFDLALLGLGEDGHTASLFPDGQTLGDSRLAAAVYVDRLKEHRVTLTEAVLARVRQILFLVSGEGKAGILRRVLERDGILPAQVIARYPGVSWLVDREAARLL
jgi:6-phosphogluconolactonase